MAIIVLAGTALVGSFILHQLFKLGKTFFFSNIPINFLCTNVRTYHIYLECGNVHYFIIHNTIGTQKNPTLYILFCIITEIIVIYGVPSEFPTEFLFFLKMIPIIIMS